MPKTRTIAATVAVSFAGSVTVGCGGHLISIAAGVSGRLDELNGKLIGLADRTDRQEPICAV